MAAWEKVMHYQHLIKNLPLKEVQLGDAANDVTANDHWMHDQGGIAVFASNPRNEHRDAASLVNRGDDQYGTPSAPCGRLCRSNGYDDQAESRQYVCGRPCPPEEQRPCPHGSGVLGSSASSSLDFWVKSFQFHAGIFDAELPIDAALFGVRLVGPGSDCRVQFGQFTDAVSASALARQAAQLAFRDMQPAAVFRGGAECDPLQYARARSGANAA